MSIENETVLPGAAIADGSNGARPLDLQGFAAPRRLTPGLVEQRLVSRFLKS